MRYTMIMYHQSPRACHPGQSYLRGICDVSRVSVCPSMSEYPDAIAHKLRNLQSHRYQKLKLTRFSAALSRRLDYASRGIFEITKP